MLSTNECKKFCKTIFHAEQSIFQNTIFRNNLFETICDNIKNKNETKIIQNINQLIILSSKTLTIFNVIHFKYLIENIDKN